MSTNKMNINDDDKNNTPVSRVDKYGNAINSNNSSTYGKYGSLSYPNGSSNNISAASSSASISAGRYSVYNSESIGMYVHSPVYFYFLMFSYFI